MQAEDYAALEAIAADNPERARELGSAWMRHMRAGAFEQAWRVSDEVLRSRRGEACRHLPRHFQWIWNGEPLDGKRVLIRCYHGLGDTIQFIRYARLVRRIARRVIVWAQPALIPLLRTADGVDELLPLHDGAPDVEYDIDVESMELPHVFRSTMETLPNEVPYLRVQPAALPRDGRLHVGLVWECGDWAPERAAPLELLLPLAQIENVTLHILQRGPALQQLPAEFGLISGCDDALEAARVIAALDLMISIDSMPAHLAGALGVRTWTLLPAKADWRWMDGRQDSPWYPTMRLFRQKRAGDWEGVVCRISKELRNLARELTRASRGSASVPTKQKS
ncbi:MAG TPA: hypothetical protein VG095_10440 [Chthoniobacterales bacterium]|nr:hypothetical protein [Chthoniobacterales bacterium]